MAKSSYFLLYVTWPFLRSNLCMRACPSNRWWKGSSPTSKRPGPILRRLPPSHDGIAPGETGLNILLFMFLVCFFFLTKNEKFFCWCAALILSLFYHLFEQEWVHPAPPLSQRSSYSLQQDAPHWKEMKIQQFHNTINQKSTFLSNTTEKHPVWSNVFFYKKQCLLCNSRIFRIKTRKYHLFLILPLNTCHMLWSKMCWRISQDE